MISCTIFAMFTETRVGISEIKNSSVDTLTQSQFFGWVIYSDSDILKCLASLQSIACNHFHLLYMLVMGH